MAFDPSILDILKPLTTGVFWASAVMSLSVLCVSICSKRKRQFPARLILIFNLMTFLFTFNVALGAAFDYSQIPLPWDNDQPSLMCKLQGAAFQFLALSLIYWYLLIYFTLYLIVCRSWTFRQVRKYRLSYTLVGVCIPCIFTLIPAFYDAFGHERGVLSCWMDEERTAFKFGFLYGHDAVVLFISCYWMYLIVRRLNELQLNVLGTASLKSLFCPLSCYEKETEQGKDKEEQGNQQQIAITAQLRYPATAITAATTTVEGVLSAVSPSPLPADVIQSAKAILERAEDEESEFVTATLNLTPPVVAAVQSSALQPNSASSQSEKSADEELQYEYVEEEVSVGRGEGREAEGDDSDGEPDDSLPDGHHEDPAYISEYESDNESTDRKITGARLPKPAALSIPPRSIPRVSNPPAVRLASASDAMKLPFLHYSPHNSPALGAVGQQNSNAIEQAVMIRRRAVSMSRNSNAADTESVHSHISPSPLIQEYIFRHLAFVFIIFLCFFCIQAWGINYEFAIEGKSSLPLWFCVLETIVVAFIGMNLFFIFGFSSENLAIIKGCWHVWIKRDWNRDEFEELMYHFHALQQKLPTEAQPSQVEQRTLKQHSSQQHNSNKKVSNTSCPAVTVCPSSPPRQRVGNNAMKAHIVVSGSAYGSLDDARTEEHSLDGEGDHTAQLLQHSVSVDIDKFSTSPTNALDSSDSLSDSTQQQP